MTNLTEPSIVPFMSTTKTIKVTRGERPGLCYITTLNHGVWTIEERQEPAGYGGEWLWYATRNNTDIALDPMPRLRDVAFALNELDASND